VNWGAAALVGSYD